MKPHRDSSVLWVTCDRALSLLIRWGPVALWGIGIFVFSSRRKPLGPLSRLNRSGLIGRLAHVGEYAGLTALLYRALADVGWEKQASWISLGGALSYAILDEIHQGFAPGRKCSLTDIAYDLVGSLVSLSIIGIGQYVLGNLGGFRQTN
jgi:VanZ family protein